MTKKPTTQARQGDVFFEMVKNLPKEARKSNSIGQIILAYGEATGHKHVVTNWKDVDSFGDAQGNIYVSSETEIVVEHDEHGKVVLDPGIYKVGRQREYDAQAANEERRVID